MNPVRKIQLLNFKRPWKVNENKYINYMKTMNYFGWSVDLCQSQNKLPL